MIRCLPRGPRDIVERQGQPVNQLVDLFVSNDVGRADAEDVAHHAAQREPALERRRINQGSPS